MPPLRRDPSQECRNIDENKLQAVLVFCLQLNDFKEECLPIFAGCIKRFEGYIKTLYKLKPLPLFSW
jgi:hypothetical protein